MLRRDFLKKVGSSFLTLASQNLYSIAYASEEIDWSYGMLPLYCLAYINPQNRTHKNQERYIAKYPISIIPQDDRPHYVKFKQQLRTLNPQQKIFCYMMTIDEQGLPGPAHRLMRAASLNDDWLTLPGNIVPTKNISSGTLQKRRIYDPRSLNFRRYFIEACWILVEKYHFDGIFLDNCTIYSRFITIPGLGKELLEGLQLLIFELRKALPTTILIGNTRYNFKGLNGEMNEGRPNDLANEARPAPGHVKPYINMYHHYMKGTNSVDLMLAEDQFRLALQHKAFFGVGINAQTVRWYNFIDRVLDEYSVI